MIENMEDRPNTYLEEARKFKAAQENANALEVQKLINMLDAASESVRKHEAMLARLRTEIAYINEALGCLGAAVPVSLGEPRNASMIVEDTQTPEHPEKTVEGYQLEVQGVVAYLVDRDVQPGTTIEVHSLVGKVRAYVANQDHYAGLHGWLENRRPIALTNMVREALRALSDEKIIRFHKNDRVGRGAVLRP
jgi:hypothetical protein